MACIAIRFFCVSIFLMSQGLRDGLFWLLAAYRNSAQSARGSLIGVSHIQFFYLI